MGTVGNLAREFRPGYSLVPAGSGLQHVLDPHGKVVRVGTGSPLALPASSQTPGWHETRRLRSSLIQAGVIAPIPRRKAKERHKPKKPTQHQNNPLVLSRTVLSDPSSTGKERSLAKEVLRQHDQLMKMKELVQRLGSYIKDLERRLDV